MKRIIFSKPLININSSKKKLYKVLKSNFINEGKETKEFEKKICKYLKVKYAVVTTSGTTALFLALKACGIKNGDEVLVPNITFPATANAVKMAGGKPIFIDINPASLLMDEKLINKKINKKTKFIIPVHISGRGNNIRNILKICKKKSIKVIEDAAEAFGSRVKNKNLGSFGLAGCFSFAPNKIITTGQGGVVVTNKRKIFLKLKILKDQGRIGPKTGGDDNYAFSGFNLKFTNLQASLGLSQFQNIKWREKKLIKQHHFYLNNIKEKFYFKIIKFNINDGELPLWTDVWCQDRNNLYEFLKKNNIFGRYYWKPMNTIKPYLQSFKKFPESKKIDKKLMWLPSDLNMNTSDQKKICDLINFYYKKKYEQKTINNPTYL